MEAKFAQSMQFSTWIDSEKILRKPSGSIQFGQIRRDKKRLQMLISGHLQPKKTSTWHRPGGLEVSRTHKKFPASIFESGSHYASFDEAMILKHKSQEIMPYLNGRCIYLVGMMGSGKTTVGKILSEVLGYSFCDSDVLVEDDVDGISVAEIFKRYGEGFFRDKETEMLRKLSLMHRLVVSTGGGAVIRPINWKYMQKGVSIWLDVPLDALAQRIADVGTHSRPLLHHGSGDAYIKTFRRLSNLFEERGDAYANANARVSLENIAAKMGLRDVSNLTPTLIAIEALEQIGGFLRGEDNGMAISGF
ncbi:hypothetical protein L1049_002465 [Liquidambar formosana]|uniref:shikimate kinase n=1 Tax=Liquidambar formosana TaxID=63359 RepID=A0AAP0NH55_LIQFO